MTASSTTDPREQASQNPSAQPTDDLKVWDQRADLPPDLQTPPEPAAPAQPAKTPETAPPPDDKGAASTDAQPAANADMRATDWGKALQSEQQKRANFERQVTEQLQAMRQELLDAVAESGRGPTQAQRDQLDRIDDALDKPGQAAATDGAAPGSTREDDDEYLTRGELRRQRDQLLQEATARAVSQIHQERDQEARRQRDRQDWAASFDAGPDTPAHLKGRGSELVSAYEARMARFPGATRMDADSLAELQRQQMNWAYSEVDQKYRPPPDNGAATDASQPTPKPAKGSHQVVNDGAAAGSVSPGTPAEKPLRVWDNR